MECEEGIKLLIVWKGSLYTMLRRYNRLDAKDVSSYFARVYWFPISLEEYFNY